MVLLHHTSDQTNDSAVAEFRLPAEMAGIACLPCNIKRDGEELRLEFNNFLCNIIADARANSYAV